MTTVKVLPSPGRLAQVMEPPWRLQGSAQFMGHLG